MSTPRHIDLERAERAVRELLVAIGEDPDRDGLKDTPARVARSYGEMFAGLGQVPGDVLTTTFEIGHDEMILVRDIEVYSTCEHHLVPFHGVAHVGYIPARSGRVTGLSKLARLVDVYARRPQVQERMTSQIADALVEHGRALVAEGADLVDVGGESTRPGATRPPADEELRRVLPVVRALAADG